MCVESAGVVKGGDGEDGGGGDWEKRLTCVFITPGNVRKVLCTSYTFFFLVNTTNIYPTDFYVAHRSLLIRLRNRGRLRRLFLLYFDLFFYFGPW